MANEIERRRWNDDRMVANWPRRERFTDQVVPYVVSALNPSPGERMLDVGSGGGKLSLAIGPLVQPRGKVTGADISAGMVRMASGRAQAAKARNVSFAVVDVQSEAIAGGPFDAATSQFGVMFFDEPLTAFANIRRQLKPGGRIAFACWQRASRNLWHPGPTLAQFALAPPPAAAPAKSPTGPFSLGDPRATRRLLREAGFVGIRRIPRRLIVSAPADSIADESQIVGAGIPVERQADAEAAMDRHFDRFKKADGLCRFELNFQIFTAWNGS